SALSLIGSPTHKSITAAASVTAAPSSTARKAVHTHTHHHPAHPEHSVGHSNPAALAAAMAAGVLDHHHSRPSSKHHIVGSSGGGGVTPFHPMTAERLEHEHHHSLARLQEREEFDHTPEAMREKE